MTTASAIGENRPGDETVRARVNPVKCQGHGICTEILPSLFVRDEWGFAQAAARDVETAERPDLDRAVEECPVRAIRVIVSAGSRTFEKTPDEER